MLKRPEKVGQYQLGNVIDKGAMAYVYKGLNLENGQTVAVKQMYLKNLKEDQQNSIQQEIELMKKFNHQNIVHYIDFIKSEDYMHIILEYIENGSLAQLLKKFGVFPEPLIVVYVKQVLQGLQYLHSQGVVHRDIKGANILITKQGIVKVADFGVAARQTEGVNDSQSFAGTPYWMAPEMIQMNGNITTSCDIWSLGSTVIELITGNPPYCDLDQYPALWRIANDPHPPFPEGLSNECRDFLLQCFQKDPQLRPTAAELLKHTWLNQGNEDIIDIMNQEPSKNFPEEVTDTIHNTIKHHINTIKEERESEFEYTDKSAKSVSKKMKASFGTTEYQYTYGDDQNLNIQTPRKSNKKVTRSNYVSIYADGSFIQLEDKEFTLPNKVYNVDSLKNLKRKSIMKKHLTNIIKDKDVASQLQKVLKALSNYNYEENQIVPYINRLQEIIEQYPSCRPALVKNPSFTTLFTILDNVDSDLNSVQVVLNFINCLIENDSKIQIKVCLTGIIPKIGKFLSPEYPKEVRSEAAYFVGQIGHSSQTTLQMLLAANGLHYLIELFDYESKNAQDLIFLGLDSILLLFDIKILPQNQIGRILVKKGLLNRLIIVINYLFLDNTKISYQYLKKTLTLIEIISRLQDHWIKTMLCQDLILLSLLQFLIKFENNMELLILVIHIFKELVQEPSILDRLEKAGMIRVYIQLLKKFVTKPSKIELNEVFTDLLKTLFFMSKLSVKRQEDIAQQGCVPLLIYFTKNYTKKIKKVSIAMICQLVQTSDKTRQKLWQCGGPQILITNLKHQIYKPMLLNALLHWIQTDSKRVEQVLLNFKIVDQLFDFIFSTDQQEFDYILPIFSNLIQSSDKLCLQLSKSSKYIKTLIERLNEGQCMEENDLRNSNEDLKSQDSYRKTARDTPIQTKAILDIVLNITNKGQNAKDLLIQNNLYPILLEILQNAQEEGKVIVEQIASQLLELYKDYNQKYTDVVQ